jgi:hypothetical protein
MTGRASHAGAPGRPVATAHPEAPVPRRALPPVGAASAHDASVATSALGPVAATDPASGSATSAAIINGSKSNPGCGHSTGAPFTTISNRVGPAPAERGVRTGNRTVAVSPGGTSSVRLTGASKAAQRSGSRHGLGASGSAPVAETQACRAGQVSEPTLRNTAQIRAPSPGARDSGTLRSSSLAA